MTSLRARTPGVRARRGALVLVVAVGPLLGACGPGVPEVDDPLAGASTGAVPLPANVGPTGCQPVSPEQRLPDGATEIQGAAEGPHASVWAKLGTPVPRDAEFRIVWRVPGSSQLRLVALGPGGERVEPTLVAPTTAPGWTRPGDAWTSTVRLPSAGCWRINAQRGQIHGDIWFEVA
jgi:hypothetical protein